MDVVIVWAWMLRKPYALERGTMVCLGMDALGVVCSRTWMILWFGHGCFGNRSEMHGTMVWAWMLWEPYVLEDGRCFCLGMDALRIVFSQKWAILWFGHECLGNRVLSNMDDTKAC